MKTPVPVHTLSDADRVAFDGYLAKWQAKLGLQDWRIKRAAKPASKANMAEVKIFHKSRMANIYLGVDFGQNTPVSPASLESSAVHELIHVLLAELVNQIEYGIEGVALDSAEHRVIHVVEHLLLTKEA